MPRVDPSYRFYPPRDETLRLYNEWPVAMEDKNVLLGRHKTRDKKIVAGLTVHP